MGLRVLSIAIHKHSNVEKVAVILLADDVIGDPNAEIGKTKDGATDMIYKPDAVMDLDTAAIVQADVHPGDHSDHKEMAVRVLEAQQAINQACGQKQDTLAITSVTSDKGYYASSELQALQHEGIRTVISDPINNRCVDKLEPEE